MIKWTYLIFVVLSFVGCDQENNMTNADISILDTCQSIPLGDTLYLGFRVNMTNKEYNSHLDGLLAKEIINSVDTTVSVFLPYKIENPLDFRLKVVPFYNDCNLYSIRLIGFTYEPEPPVYEIDRLMTEKYGKGIEDGYTIAIIDNGRRTVNGIYGAESIFAQVKSGETITGFYNIENNETSGRREWNVNGILIDLVYTKDMIQIEYHSLSYKEAQNKKIEEDWKRQDSLNLIKINKNSQIY